MRRRKTGQSTSPADTLREFVYLDEPRVVSLLAALQGAIPESVTETMGRNREWALGGAAGAKGIGKADARLGSTTSSVTETLRRAVAQSTFRELWRRDSNVVLHDPENFRADLGTPLRTSDDLSRRIEALIAQKAAVAVSDIRRGSIAELGWQVRQDDAFRTLAAAKMLFDLVSGREHLLGLDASQFTAIGPMFEVLAEFTVGLVPLRGVCTSHHLVSLGGDDFLIHGRALDPAGSVALETRELEIVSFAEADSFWRDPRTMIIEGFECTGYLRMTGEALRTQPWNPMKLADVLEALGPGMRDGAIEALEFLRRPPQVMTAPELTESRLFGVVEHFGQLLAEAAGVPGTPIPAETTERVAQAVGAAQNVVDQRRAMDALVQDIPGAASLERGVVLGLRARAYEAVAEDPGPTEEEVAEAPQRGTAQLEVATVALYW